jgi:hypothetical protein
MTTHIEREFRRLKFAQTRGYCAECGHWGAERYHPRTETWWHTKCLNAQDFMQNKKKLVTGESKASRDEVYIPVITHPIISKAWRKDQGHCAGKRALKVYGQVHGKKWRQITVNRTKVSLIDDELHAKLVWPTYLSDVLFTFIVEYDDGHVIDDEGVIAPNVAAEIPFKLALKDATIIPIKTIKRGKARKPRKRETKARKPYSKINPSYHRTHGFLDTTRSKIFTDVADDLVAA